MITPSLPPSIREALDAYGQAAGAYGNDGPHANELKAWMESARAALEQHIAALVADAERLDAIEKGGWNVTPDTGSRWTVWVNAPTGGGDFDEVELTRGNRPATLRAAIDAARRPPPEDTTPA